MQKIIITGAGKGIGLAIARACIKAGYHAIACDLDEPLLEKARAEFGPGVTTHQLDVSDHAQVKRFFDGLDPADWPIGLVNNAGVYPAKNILDYAPEEISRVFEVNVYGAIYFTRLFAAPLVKAQAEGVIVNISSVAQYGSADAVYGSSKGAVAALTRCCAMNLSPYVRVNAIAPGIVRTDMFNAVPEHILEWYRKTELVKEPLQPEDVAATALFLLGEEARHYTGATFDLNNGFHRR